MSRKLAYALVACAWTLSAGIWIPGAVAQNPPSAGQPRPQNANLQAQELSPRLNQLLEVWSQRSSKIQKLQGTHRRFVYDKVFNVDKRSTGAFYYEAPGKGRIDLQPAKIRPGTESKQADPKTGKPFKVQPDRAERWICDGKEIWQVNDATKQVDIFPIPKQNQGKNIMNGPMPFLFGMPPAQAKRRYFLKLVHEDKAKAVLEVHPRLQIDAANWQKADVILNKELYLPTAVRLTDPTGNLVTTYTFGDFHINKANQNWIVEFFGIGKNDDPFRPNLRKKGYTITHHKPKQKQNPGKQGGPAVPSLAGMTAKDAAALLKNLGCQAKFYTGKKAPQDELTHVVYEQKPAAKSPLQKGQTVTMTVFAKGPVKTAQAPPNNPAPQGQVPSVSGLFWKKAGEKLKQAGYQVKYLPGDPAKTKDKVYQVYEQAPKAGQPLKAGGQVTLTVYNEME